MFLKVNKVVVADKGGKIIIVDIASSNLPRNRLNQKNQQKTVWLIWQDPYLFKKHLLFFRINHFIDHSFTCTYILIQQFVFVSIN